MDKKKITKKEAIELRTDFGRFLHSYFIQFGENKYEEFVKKIGDTMVVEYGDSFSSDNLRIMEAEYVAFNSKINEKKQSTDKKNITY